jgi:hypothetical protein
VTNTNGSMKEEQPPNERDYQLTYLGAGAFVLGHVVAFFFHVLWPAVVALLGVTSDSWGLSLSAHLNFGIQTLALLFLLGAWIPYFRKFQRLGFDLKQVGFGLVLTGISLFVFYQWIRTMMVYMTGL